MDAKHTIGGTREPLVPRMHAPDWTIECDSLALQSLPSCGRALAAALVVCACVACFAWPGCAEEFHRAHERVFRRQIARLRQGSTELSFYATEQTDDKLRRVAQIVHDEDVAIHQLTIDCADVTDEGLKYVATIPSLRQVYLLDIDITREGLRHVCRSHSIQTLGVRARQFREPGVQGLTGASPNLRAVTLSLDWASPIDEQCRSASLEALKRLTHLQSLTVDGNWVRPEDIRALREALPEVEIRTDTRFLP
jgi:hypothetical protein